MNTNKLKLISQAELEKGSVKGFPDVVAGDATVLKNAFVKPSLNIAEVMNANIESLTVALSNVDNTADVDKPISTATQTAIDKLATKESPIINNATLNGTTIIKSISLIANLVYPVGSIYQSTKATSPEFLFGGKWERFCGGSVLVGVKDGDASFGTVNKNGILNHAHAESVALSNYYGLGPEIYVRDKNNQGDFKWYRSNAPVATETNLSLEPVRSFASVGQPEYVTVYMWVRTA